jgi:hypothetical protein
MGRPKIYNFANEEERKAHVKKIAKCSCGFHNKSRPNHICADYLLKLRSRMTDDNGIYDIEAKNYYRYRYKGEGGKRTAICIGYKKRGKEEAYKIMLERIKKLDD